MAWIDRDLFEKVLFNLLSNAYKYSETGGNVELKLSSTDKAIEFSVADTGVGIAPNELPHIFEQFYRAPSANKGHRRQGTGIGLALVKSIVELHQGQITVESEVGKGSVFSVSIPSGNAHFQPDVIKNTPSIDPLLLDASIDEVATMKAIEHADKPVLLVVEDNADIRRFVHHNLGTTYAIIEAENGAEGWEKTQKYIPDIILSDVVMPEMDGFELCRKVKNQESTAHIPVILLSARSSQMYLAEGFDTGADDYMPKPFSVELLQVRIRNLLGNRERLQKHLNQHLTHKPNVELAPAELDITHLDKQFLDKCIALIEKNMDDPEYSVEQMSHELFVSRMQFYRKIKALTGDAPSGFIRTIRLKRAAQLLEKGYSVAEATYQVGFQDLRYFREHFKKQFGVNPSEFAQQSSSSAMNAEKD
jgi:DNA-binding response OmpR family regulator